GQPASLDDVMSGTHRKGQTQTLRKKDHPNDRRCPPRNHAESRIGITLRPRGVSDSDGRRLAGRLSRAKRSTVLVAASCSHNSSRRTAISSGTSWRNYQMPSSAVLIRKNRAGVRSSHCVMDMARPRESQRTSVLARLSASSFEILTALLFRKVGRRLIARGTGTGPA